MPRKRRQFSRKLGKLRYRSLFIIAVEGGKSEPQYFGMFNNQTSVIRVECLKARYKSSPHHVLMRMKDRLKEYSLKNTDEAWLVVDKDNWLDKQLKELYAWSLEKENYGFALSNPKFEYWLLLHFEDGKNISSSNDCSNRLKKYLPNYDKNIDLRKISKDMVKNAIERARNRDTPPCSDWPHQHGSTIYRLIENIINRQ